MIYGTNIRLIVVQTAKPTNIPVGPIGLASRDQIVAAQQESGDAGGSAIVSSIFFQYLSLEG
jgi:hypothetical protein